MVKQILRSLLFLAFTALVTTSYAKQIPIEQAESLVKTVIQRNGSDALRNARNLRIVSRFTKSEDGVDNFYIFNLAPTGFVIIAADDRYNAVLAFSDESNIDLSKKQDYVGLWGTLSKHESRINYVRENSLTPNLAIQNEWKTLRSGNTATSRENAIVVAPLTTTKWNQGLYYNGECPADEDSAANGPDGRTYCGCGPIAMAQLIKFHNSPVTGNGQTTYIDPIYGEQTADFCTTDYNWDNMPDELTESNPDVAKLIYHMGVSTYTYYSTDYTETYLSYIRDAFVNNFGFDQSANWFYDGNNDFPWVARNDLDRGRPLLLSGVSVFGGAHTWVADGYGYFDATGGEGTDEYFHFNWGWGGDNNGWFLDSDESWFPRGDQENTVEISYYFDRYVVQNLFPAPNGCQAPDNFYANGIDRDAVYLNVQYYSGEQEISFRYRKIGEPTWVETAPTTDFFQLIQGLEQATEYEYQARRKCCPSDWSDWSEAQTFASAGFVPCTPLAASGMSADGISDRNAYVYTVQPFGAVTNQFRYRPVGTTDWLYTDNTTNYYRFLSDLLAGTEYEVQVKQQCSNGDFSDFSGSFMFMTSGQKEGNPDNGDGDGGDSDNPCTAIDGNSLTISSTTDNNTYVYTPQPLGAVNNQFRYRPVGTTDWLETDISTVYYQYLGGLTAGTAYEFQVRQECEAGQWSNYSTSGNFTTTGENPGGMDGGDDDTDGGDDGDDGGNTNGGDCDPVDVSGLFTSSIGSANAYIYTPQPLGAVKNQFRYRPQSTDAWLTTDISTVYYRYLSGLQAGTAYEFQTRQECSTDNWSNYSESEYFTTTGNQISSKLTINSTVPAALTWNELEQINPVAYGIKGASTNLGIKSISKIMVYPNPTSSLLYIESNFAFSKNDDLKIIDRMGRRISNIAVSVGHRQAKVDVSNLESGIYMIQLTTEQEVKVVKFLKG